MLPDEGRGAAGPGSGRVAGAVMSGTATTIHNARITLLANLLNAMAGSAFAIGVLTPSPRCSSTARRRSGCASARSFLASCSGFLPPSCYIWLSGWFSENSESLSTLIRNYGDVFLCRNFLALARRLLTGCGKTPCPNR
jgi:hypothetical protein